MLRTSGDGSSTLYSEKFKQHYHSVFGAKTESEWIYIELGLFEAIRKFETVNIFELGFGTGLNAFLSSETALQNRVLINYTGIEAYPVSPHDAVKLNFDVSHLHNLSWNDIHQTNPYFKFRKVESFLEEFQPDDLYNLVYFDAFAPEAQPELWTSEVFEKMAGLLIPGGILTTYCSKVYVQRNMRSAGFSVEKCPGPPHKREVLRATKL